MIRISVKSIKYCLPLIVFLSLSVPRGFAQEIEYYPGQNRGNIISKYIPENKKARAASVGKGLAQTQAFAGAKQSEISLEQAVAYRQTGLDLQRAGKLDSAVSNFEKAVMLDPYYAEAYNDLGVVYEIKGFFEKAKAAYLRAIKIKPEYPATYSNLALFYETKGDLKTAAYYWKKRIKIGSPDDYWNKKAMIRLQQIGLTIKDTAQYLEEERVIDLIEEVSSNRQQFRTRPVKAIKRSPAVMDSEQHLISARMKLLSGDISAALNEAVIAKHLDPFNAEIDRFIEEVHNKAQR